MKGQNGKGGLYDHNPGMKGPGIVKSTEKGDLIPLFELSKTNQFDDEMTSFTSADSDDHRIVHDVNRKQDSRTEKPRRTCLI